MVYICSWATLFGLLILVLSTPASGIFVRRLTMLRRDMLKHTDTRVKLTNQLLVGIRVLKIYAWEAAQEAAVGAVFTCVYNFPAHEDCYICVHTLTDTQGGLVRW